MEKEPIPVKPAQGNIGLPQNQTYEQLFLDNHDMQKRGEKSVFVRPEYHKRLSRIVHIAGDNDIPKYAYLDNILKDHFEQIEQATSDDYQRKIKPIF
jgi:hypothetical protein